jgi:hypothetical protein
VDKVRNAERLLTSTDPNIHHGQGMTCVYRAETALCRSARQEAEVDIDGPDESDCRSACTNLAYTERDIALLRERLIVLETGAVDPLSPRPLRDRSAAQAAQVRAIIERHEHTPQGAGDALDGAACRLPGRLVCGTPCGANHPAPVHADRPNPDTRLDQ